MYMYISFIMYMYYIMVYIIWNFYVYKVHELKLTNVADDIKQNIWQHTPVMYANHMM